ncbi:oligosaccharide flippase family protein [Natronolimnohabitans innermongolicus]|uniref:oligosaccharide flippase family protein n=1 Tax=Natronolimnohabitans innermongolicus TaxID=253107 RepID=UPI000A02DCF3|nr:oligosaccharide flippase family protein [Natronolimnohabitans innermongolicus]
MGISQKISTDVLVTTLVKLSLKVRGLIVIPILTIYLGAADYGAYVQILAITTLVGQVAILGLDTGIVQYIQQYNDDEAVVYWSIMSLIMVTSVVSILVVITTSSLLSQYTLGTTDFTTAFVIGAGLVPLTIGFRLGQGYLRATRRIKIYSYSDAAEVYLHVGSITAVVLLTEWGIVGVMAAVVATRCLVVLIMHAAIIFEVGFSKPSLARLQAYLNYSLPTMGTDVARSTLTRADRVLVGFFLGASAVGVYSVAYQLAQVMMIYIRPLSISLFPEFSRLWSNDPTQIQMITIPGLRYFLALAIPSIGGLWLVGQDVLNLLTTSEIASSAVPLLILLSAGILFQGLTEIYTQLFYAADKTRIPLIIQASSAIINVVANIILLPTVGLAGAALATLLAYGFAATTTAIGFQEYLKIIPPLQTVLAPITGTTVMIVVFASLTLNWILTIALAPFLYGLVFYAAGGIEYIEIKRLMDHIRTI